MNIHEAVKIIKSHGHFVSGTPLNGKLGYLVAWARDNLTEILTESQVVEKAKRLQPAKEVTTMEFDGYDSQVRQVAKLVAQFNPEQLGQLQEIIEGLMLTVEFRNWVVDVDHIIEETRPMTHKDLGVSTGQMLPWFEDGFSPEEIARKFLENYDTSQVVVDF